MSVSLTLRDNRLTSFFSKLTPQMRALIFMFLAMFFFTGMSVFIRKSAEQLHIMEVIFLRNLLACFLIIPIMIPSGIKTFKMYEPRLFFFRAIVGSIGMIAGFIAFILIPLAQATAISFTTPIFVTIGATFLLGEIIKVRRIVAIFVGFLGMLVIIQPGAGAMSIGVALAFISAGAHSVNALLVKKMTTKENPNAIVAWMVILIVPITVVPAFFVWEWPSGLTWVYLWSLALFGTLAHMCFTRAFASAEVTSLQALEFIKLPMTAFIAWLIFAEVPGVWTWIGGVIIFSSTVYITHREAKLNKSMVVNSNLLDPK
jgi:drug/metabolite transporter (DMT)-like permease